MPKSLNSKITMKVTSSNVQQPKALRLHNQSFIIFCKRLMSQVYDFVFQTFYSISLSVEIISRTNSTLLFLSAK